MSTQPCPDGYTVILSPQFHRRAEKFLRHRHELRPRFTQVIAALTHDPFLPTLDLHAMHFAAGLYAVSLTYSYRLLLRIEGRTVVLTAIGAHERVYRS